jgi:hypothetical protein
VAATQPLGLAPGGFFYPFMSGQPRPPTIAACIDAASARSAAGRENDMPIRRPPGAA